MNKTRILVIEDDAAEAERLLEIFDILDYGYVQFSAEEGHALQTTLEFRPELLLVCIGLNGDVGGISIAAKIQSQLDIPIIYLTNYAEISSLQEAIATRPYGYLIKPVHERELGVAIELALYKHQIDQKIKESEERYRTVVSLAQEAILLFDAQTGKMIEANLAFERLFGYSKEDISQLDIYSIVPGDDQDDRDNTRPVMAERQIFFGEQKYRHKDGHLIDVEVGRSVITYGGRKMISLVVHDLTRSKQTEQSLRESEAKSRALLEALPDLIFLVSDEGVYLDYLASSRENLLVQPEEFLGKKQQDILPDHIWRQAEIATQRTLETGLVQVFEYELKLGSSTRHYEARCSVCDQKRVIYIIRDITERKQAEEALRQSEEHFRLLVEGLKNYAVFMLDAGGKITSWNAGAERLLGYQEAEVLGREFACFYSPEEIVKHRPQYELRIAKNKNIYEIEGWRFRKDGSRFWTRTVITALFNQSGDLINYAVVMRDITSRKREDEVVSALRHQPMSDF